MIKLTFAVRRRADVDPGEFHRYWRDEHGPLVRSFQSVLGIRRYVQVHRVDTPFNDVLRQSRGALEPFDGTAEVWWDDLESLAAGTSTPTSITEVRSSSCDTALAALLANSPTTATNTGDAPRSACTAPSAASIVALISCSRSAVVVMPGRLRACWPAKAHACAFRSPGP